MARRSVRAALAATLRARGDERAWLREAAGAGIAAGPARRLYAGRRTSLDDYLAACRVALADPVTGRRDPGLARRAIPAGEFLPWLFGSYVVALRCARGWSVDALAARCGLTVDRVRGLEEADAGVRGALGGPTVEAATALARELGFDLFACCARVPREEVAA